jgi:hypothetical protein
MALVAAAAFSFAAPPVQAQAANPIKIEQCFVTVPKAMSKKASGTQIVYVNTGPKTATSVTFAVAYRNASSYFLRRVTDAGTFSPNAKINHHFALYNDITYGGKTTLECKALKVKWADGTEWLAQ